MKEPFVHPLGISVSEFRLIKQAMWAWSQVPNGNFLPAPRWKKAAERLIARGYLTRCPNVFSPPQPGWIVILISRENIAKYNADLAAAMGGYEG